MTVLLGLIASYLLGSIPTALLVGKFYGGVDVRKVGSGNIGATNVARAVGKKAGLITLIGDMLKGALPVAFFILFVGTDTFTHQLLVCLAGLAAFLGHLFPIYLKFKGGKGVATATGVFLVLSPLAVLGDLLVFLFVVWRWRYVSLASITAAAFLPTWVGLVTNKKLYIILAVVIAMLVIYRHKDNINRLLQGKELKFSATPPANSAGG
jgi:glycerol-3-phosphate acyltransferase PlsY